MKGNLISNKKEETIIESINTAQIYDIFWTDNGGEFLNTKMDELTFKLGISVKFGPAFSPWLNGLNEWSHASVGITIKKRFEDKKVQLLDSLVKAAAWTQYEYT